MANSDRGEGLRVSRAEINQMIAAATVMQDCRRDLAFRDSDVVREVTGDGAVLLPWRHYPEAEVYDSRSHGQYFFHMHPQDDRQAPERGHFHIFMRAEGMPNGVAPLLLPELAVADVAGPPQAAPRKRGIRDEVSHLIAIAVNRRGEPTCLFTTNRWVTGETWYRAEDVTRMLDVFVISEGEPSVVLNRWISATVHLFRPQIMALLRARDETVMAWRRRRRTHVFEDRRLEITSSLNVDLDAQLAFVEDARNALEGGASRRSFALPSMAEGWEATQG